MLFDNTPKGDVIMVNEEIRKIVMGLRPIDDDFMNVIFNNNTPLVEYVLRIILDKDDLIVESSETQHELEIFGSRKLYLDVFAKDSTGKKFNIEVQRSDSGAIAQRARYHSAAIDVSSLEKGADFKELPDSYVIFITENDVLKGSEATYRIERVVIKSNEPFNDGTHIVYVNGAYRDISTAVGRLIHDFVCHTAEEMLCEPMAEVTNKYKNTHEGVDYMCKAVEEYGLKQRNEGRLEGIEEGMKKGIKEGRLEGRLEGIKEGIKEGIIESVKKLVKKGTLSYGEISETFDISVEEVQRIAAQVS